MFLDALLSRNPRLVAGAAQLACEGAIPPNTVVLDLDAIRANGMAIRAAADLHGLSLYWMFKQVGRNPLVAQALVNPGSAETVSVDVACADALHSNGFGLGHVGNLVQISRADLRRLLTASPEVVTVFSVAKAKQVSDMAHQLGLPPQGVLLRVADPAVDTYLPGMEGGFLLDELNRDLAQLRSLPGINITGVTTFPTISYSAPGSPRPTGNASTLRRAAAQLTEAGLDVRQVNAPGNTCSLTVPLQAELGATHIEPGHGFLGTTPYHLQYPNQPEIPAACYVSEVAHHWAGKAYVYGGGFFVDDPVWLQPDFKRCALVGRTPDELLETRAPVLGVGGATGGGFGGIDYYAMIDANEVAAPVGASVIFGFRVQSFVTRANVAVVDHLGDRPRLLGIFDQLGRRLPWFEDKAAQSGP